MILKEGTINHREAKEVDMVVCLIQEVVRGMQMKVVIRGCIIRVLIRWVFNLEEQLQCIRILTKEILIFLRVELLVIMEVWTTCHLNREVVEITQMLGMQALVHKDLSAAKEEEVVATK